MNGNHCLNSSSLNLVPLLQAHSCEVVEQASEELLFLLKLNDLLFVGPGSALNGHALLGSGLALKSDRGLHGLFKLDQPVFDVALSLDVVSKLDRLSEGTHDHCDFDDELSVLLIEGDSVDGIKQFLEVV